MDTTAATSPTTPLVKEEILQEIKEETKTSTLTMKVASFAKTFFKAFVAGTLFFTSTTLFCLGFVIGVVWDKSIRANIQKICDLWNSYSIPKRTILVLAGFLALPISISGSAFIMGAHLGSMK